MALSALINGFVVSDRARLSRDAIPKESNSIALAIAVADTDVVVVDQPSLLIGAGIAAAERFLATVPKRSAPVVPRSFREHHRELII